MSHPGFYGHDPRVCVCTHGDTNDVSGRQSAPLDKHGNNSVLGITSTANRDRFTFEIRRFFDVGIRH
jgi:hypothetical protein